MTKVRIIYDSHLVGGKNVVTLDAEIVESGYGAFGVDRDIASGGKGVASRFV